MYDLFNPYPEHTQSNPEPVLISKNAENVPGLIYTSNFLSETDERNLIGFINSQNWLTDIRRRVQHYGYKYDYRSRRINYDMFLGALPNWLSPLAARLQHEGYFNTMPDQAIINEYLPGQGIANHVDCEPCFGETVASISLASYCIMDFINLASKKKIEMLLEPRSLVSISGEARHLWSHGISQRKIDQVLDKKIERATRISITFRKVVI